MQTLGQGDWQLCTMLCKIVFSPSHLHSGLTCLCIDLPCEWGAWQSEGTPDCDSGYREQLSLRVQAAWSKSLISSFLLFLSLSLWRRNHSSPWTSGRALWPVSISMYMPTRFNGWKDTLALFLPSGPNRVPPLSLSLSWWSCSWVHLERKNRSSCNLPRIKCQG